MRIGFPHPPPLTQPGVFYENNTRELDFKDLQSYSRAPYSASSSDRSSAYVHQTQSWLAGPRGPVHNSTSFRLGLEITILGPSERQRWRNSTAVFRSLPPHPTPCLSRTPHDGVLGELGLTVLEGVLCERVSNGVASIHPGPRKGLS